MKRLGIFEDFDAWARARNKLRKTTSSEYAYKDGYLWKNGEKYSKMSLNIAKMFLPKP